MMTRSAVLLMSALLLSACAQVKPWERGDLARPEMALEPDPIEAGFKQHIYSVKETANGGFGVGGGGCGCN